MKRFTRRTIGVGLGLALGWWAAGLAPSLLTSTSRADQDHGGKLDGPAGAAASQLDGAGHAPNAAAGHGPGKPNGPHADAGQQAAKALIPQDADATWYVPVLVGAGLLFVAAIVLGIPALKLRGPEPPDPAEAHGHDHHADDAQSHDHGSTQPGGGEH